MKVLVGPSRGLFRDYEPSDSLRFKLYSGNTATQHGNTGPSVATRWDQQAAGVTGVEMTYSDTLDTERSSL